MEEEEEVQTRSVEHILALLMAQTTTLVSWQAARRWAAGPPAAEAAGAARAGRDLLRAVERFARLGELLAAQEHELEPAALRASADVRGAGRRIAELMGAGVPGGQENEDEPAPDRGQRSALPDAVPEQPGLARAARLLLSSVARTLLLADRAAIKHIVGFRNQVLQSLEGLERAESPAEMVLAFNDFTEAIEPFVNLSAERERDLKDERQAARIGVARDVLEKAPMMMLAACKTLLSHGGCGAARAARERVLGRVRSATCRVVDIVAAETTHAAGGGGGGGNRGPTGTTLLPDGTAASLSPAVATRPPGSPPCGPTLRRDEERPVPATSVTGSGPGTWAGVPGRAVTGGARREEDARDKALPWLCGAVDTVKTHVEGLREGRLQARHLERARLLLLLGPAQSGVRDFTEAACVSGEHRDRLLRLWAEAQVRVDAIAGAVEQAVPLEQQFQRGHEMELTLIAACQTLDQLKRQLQVAAVAGAMRLLSSRPGERTLARLPEEAATGHAGAVRELAASLSERQEALSEVCRLLRHVAETEPLGIRCSHLDDCIQSTVQQILSASQVLEQNPESRAAFELLEVCRQAWAECLAALTVLVRDTVDTSYEKGSSQSLHSHGDEAEVARLAAGVRERTSELEAEVERWPRGGGGGGGQEEKEDAAVLLCVQDVCNAAYATCLLAKGGGGGGGLHKCTPDLLKKAAVLADECVKLSSLLENIMSKLARGEGQPRLGVEQARLCVTAVRDASAVPVQEATAKVAAVMQAAEDLLATLLPTVQIARMLKEKMGA
ncbi:alpha-catulin-like [Lethenteron reissneri]|uniref:alpha-catulin-like n=1 Tax=Lethenteron reissneri TaxID=7753 RepID=UPI002AB6AF9D|nr:alpha-catulin-like [Lethenteron reissneri]